ncbi:MAG: hypothetical protein HZB35_01715 [Nitrospirae bacterium]|nr:hypothetical protein [Nitrospirota bacterium]
MRARSTAEGAVVKAPPALAVLACLLLFGWGELTGALQGGFRNQILAAAAEAAQAHPAVHQLTGLSDVDQSIVEGIAQEVLARLHTFHVHTHGLALVTLALVTVIANIQVGDRMRTFLMGWTILGLVYPFGWLTVALALPAQGKAAAFVLAERWFFIPFGGLYLSAVGTLIAVYAWQCLRAAGKEG